MTIWRQYYIIVYIWSWFNQPENSKITSQNYILLCKLHQLLKLKALRKYQIPSHIIFWLSTSSTANFWNTQKLPNCQLYNLPSIYIYSYFFNQSNKRKRYQLFNKPLYPPHFQIKFNQAENSKIIIIILQGQYHFCDIFEFGLICIRKSIFI